MNTASARTAALPGLTLGVLLDLATRQMGLEFDPAAAARLVDAHAGAAPDEALRRAGAAFGLRVTVVEAPPASVSKAPGTDQFVAFLPAGPRDGEAPTWVFARRRGREFEVFDAAGRAHRRSARSLSHALGAGDRPGPMTCAWFEPLALCEGMGARDLAGGPHARDGQGDGHGHASISPLARLFALMRPERADVRTVVVFAVAVGLLSLAAPLTIEALINSVVLNQLAQQLLVLSVVLLVCLGLAAALRAAQTYVVEIIQRRLFVRVASDLAYRLPRVRADAFDRQHGPELVNRFFDVLTVQKVSAMLLLDGLAIVLQSALGMAVLAFYSPYLLAFDIVVIVSITFAVFWLGRGAVATSIDESRAKYAVAAALEDIVRAPIAHKLGGGPDLAWLRTDGLSRVYLTARRRHFVILMRQIVFALGFQAVATAGLLGLGGWLVINGQLTPGQLVAAELIVATVVGSFAKLGKHLEGWYDLMAAVDKLGHLIDLPLERQDGEPHNRRSSPAALDVDNVEFGFGHDGAVLRHLSLSIAPGERVAVVGTSGSGKSTLVDIVTGLREPAHGAVLLDGAALRDLNLDQLREDVALVRGIDVVEGTILDNVRFGRAWVSLSDIYAALDAVGLTAELARLSEALHTRIFPTGAPLPLDQVRRLMLARAIVGGPRLLVLDEVLNGIDADHRPRVLEAIFGSGATWSVLVVTQLPDVVARCDRVLTLRGGRVDRETHHGNGTLAVPHSREGLS